MSLYQLNTSNIWFVNQKEPVYDPSDDEAMEVFNAYWQQERDRCMNGFFIADGQIKISGRLYFTTVYAKIAAYLEKVVRGKPRKVREIITPLFRDLEWDIINTDIEKCTDDGKFYDLVGSRDFGKSVIAGMCAAWLYTFFSKSEAVISSSAYGYIKLVTDKIEDCLLNLHPIFKKQRLTSDWKKEIVAGWKDSKTNLPDTASSFSSIKVRNFEGGNNPMAAVGTRPGFHLIDEIGTLPNLIGCVKDSDGCYWSGGGDKPSCFVFRTGCVCAGTKVWAADGRLLNIEDLKQEDGIIGYDGVKAVKQNINWLKAPEKKPCYRITTEGNNIIECSEDHPFISTSRKKRTIYKGLKNVMYGSYTETKNLSVGDYILTITEIPFFGNLVVEDSYLLGLMLGDGYFKGSSVSIDDTEIREYIVNKYETSVRKQFFTKSDELYTDLYIKGVKNLFKNNGLLNLTKANKRLPINIHEYDKKSIASILAGIFDSDGNVYLNKIKGTRIVLTNISLLLLEDVKGQLLKFGIDSSIYKEFRNTEPQGEYKGQQDYIYRLYISRDIDVQSFIESIPIKHSKKIQTLSLFKRGNRNFRTAKVLFRYTQECEDENFLKDNELLSGYSFKSIKSIEFIGDKEVYNLNAEGFHNYIAGGFITGNTGGDMEVGKEAGEVFFNPGSYNGLEFNNPEIPGTKMGRFISALRAKMAYKEPWTLYKYLVEKCGYVDLKPHKDLEVEILVSNEEKALEEWWKPEYAKALKSGNSKTVLKFKAYWPLKASDSFLVLTKNDYNIEAAQQQQQRLRALGITGSLVELYHDGTKVTHKFSQKLPITEFPVKTQNKDAPIQVWEFPISELPPFGLYVAGVDNYRQGKAEYSDSLGVVYIFKRIHDINSEKYQDMLVAALAARPESPERWNEQARLLIKWFNARTLCENDDMTFINYMISKGDGHYLEDQPQWLKLYVPNTTVQRDKGIHRSSEKVRDMLRAGSKKYLDEVIVREKDEQGSVTKELLGVTKIPDPMLLEEIIHFNEDEGNYDREVAFSLAIALRNHLDPIIGKVGGEGDSRIEQLFKKPIRGNRLFKAQTKMFQRPKRKLFSK